MPSNDDEFGFGGAPKPPGGFKEEGPAPATVKAFCDTCTHDFECCSGNQGYDVPADDVSD